MTLPDEQAQLLEAAVTAAQRGDRAMAQRLIETVLERNPANLVALSWACELAAERKDKIAWLERILALNPADRDAARYLARLRRRRGSRPGRGPGRWLAWLGQIVGVALILALAAGLVYALPRGNLLGLRGPDFDSLVVADSFEQIASDDYVWQVVYERTFETEFSGTVRHATPIRIGRLRILTHDILVTSGEYADPALVNTSVSNHRFRWSTQMERRPQGAINLLHTVPADQSILEQLQAIERGDQVTITGREILRINVYDLEGQARGDWHDEGCNTLLVTAVSFDG